MYSKIIIDSIEADIVHQVHITIVVGIMLGAILVQDGTSLAVIIAMSAIAIVMEAGKSQTIQEENTILAKWNSI